MDGRAYLEKVIADQLRSARQLPEASRGGAVNVAEIEGIATGLAAAGALLPGDAERILTDLRKTMQRTSSATLPFGRTEQADWPETLAEPKPSALLRVVSLAGRTFKQGDVLTTLISLDVWSTMLILRTAIAMPDDWGPETQRRYWDARWRYRAWDDAGTQYRTRGGPGTSNHDLLFQNRTFFPGPPDEATQFTVIVEHPDHQSALELPLT